MNSSIKNSSYSEKIIKSKWSNITQKLQRSRYSKYKDAYIEWDRQKATSDNSMVARDEHISFVIRKKATKMYAQREIIFPHSILHSICLSSWPNSEAFYYLSRLDPLQHASGTDFPIEAIGEALGT